VALERANSTLVSVEGVEADERQALREEARAVLERIEHHEGLALYWWGLALESWYALRSTGTKRL